MTALQALAIAAAALAASPYLDARAPAQARFEAQIESALARSRLPALSAAFDQDVIKQTTCTRSGHARL